MKLLVVVLSALILTGCATPNFRKPGGTMQEFYKAKTTCQVQLNLTGITGYFQQKQYVRECLAGEGWFED